MSAAIHRTTSPDFAASPLSWIYRFIFSRSIFVLLCAASRAMGASMMSRTSRSSCMSARFNRWWNGSLVSVTLSTKVPRPCCTLKYPMFTSILMASRTVERPTPNSFISSGSVGSFSPLVNFPSFICSLIREETSSASDFF